MLLFLKLNLKPLANELKYSNWSATTKKQTVHKVKT